MGRVQFIRPTDRIIKALNYAIGVLAGRDMLDDGFELNAVEVFGSKPIIIEAFYALQVGDFMVVTNQVRQNAVLVARGLTIEYDGSKRTFRFVSRVTEPVRLAANDRYL